MYNSLEPASFQSWIDTNSASFKSTEFVWNEVYCNLPAAAKQSAARPDMLLVQTTEVLLESARFRYFHYSFTYINGNWWKLRHKWPKKSSVPWCYEWHMLFHVCMETTTKMAQKDQYRETVNHTCDNTSLLICLHTFAHKKMSNTIMQ